MTTFQCTFCERSFFVLDTVATDANNNIYCPRCLAAYYERYNFNLNDIMKKIKRKDVSVVSIEGKERQGKSTTAIDVGNYLEKYMKDGEKRK